MDRLLLNRAWRLIEEQKERSVDGVGLSPWRPHDVWSALVAVAPDFTSYRRLNDRVAESAHALNAAESLVQIAELPKRQLQHVFQHAMTLCDEP